MTRAELYEIDQITDLATNPSEWAKVYGNKTLAQVLMAKTKKDLATINFGEVGKTMNGKAVVGKAVGVKKAAKKTVKKVVKPTVSSELLNFMKKQSTTKKVSAKKPSAPKRTKKVIYSLGRKITLWYEGDKIVEKIYH